MCAQDAAAVLESLVGANVQFVVVGDPGDPSESSERRARELRVVVSRHPTNLDALGRALDSLGSALRVEEGDRAGLRRVGDPLGTVSVTALGVDVDLMFGGPRQSLYAETLAAASEREIAGVHVMWADQPARLEPPPRATGSVLGRRLLSIAEGIVHLVDRRDDRPPEVDVPDAGPGSAGTGSGPAGSERDC